MFDKSARDDGTFSREDFAYDQEVDVYVCPAGKVLRRSAKYVTVRGDQGQAEPRHTIDFR